MEIFKKLNFMLLLIFSMATFSFNSCDTNKNKMKKENENLMKQLTRDESVLINGVKWAISNVGAHSPTDYGEKYNWKDAKASCPAGWRLPTQEELQTF
ncbi:MAG: fibrobacter succinogenes major paralogous domain-containing protein [Prevotellaceae bacterium]|jgi:hypothetical protein|nr:fibrobacter succinogenes major paralogous domain-containing protein [Prevotellaceae bacterium]